METRQFATFTVDTLLFGVEVYKVQEVIRFQEMTVVPLAGHGAAGLINLRGEVVPAIDMRTRLGLPPLPAGVSPMNVVVRVDNEPISLLVDAIGEVAHVTVEQFEEPPETMTGPGRALITGAYKLQGSLLLALDVNRVADVSALA
jgi:purine-binding chemotaxis protein CheW